ncbi:MAG TPA: hypothetical protein VF693_06605 [Allosphingosinicella sp.]|jgi:hypothetical protein
MVTYDFIPEELYEHLPEDRTEQFWMLFEAATLRFNEVSASMSGDPLHLSKIRYMSQIDVIAHELGIGSLPVPTGPPVTDNEWNSFQSALTAIRTRFRLRKARISGEFSVFLGRATKFRIEQEIERLRDLITKANLPDKKKKALYKKLDELLGELHRQRLSFAKLASIAAAIAGVLGGSSTALANGPEAIEMIGRILQWVGEEKAAEDEEQLALAAPPKALPPPGRDQDSPSEDQTANE